MRGEYRIQHGNPSTATSRFQRWSRNRDQRMRPAGTVWCSGCGMVPIFPETRLCRKCRLRRAKIDYLQRRRTQTGKKRATKLAIQQELF